MGSQLKLRNRLASESSIATCMWTLVVMHPLPALAQVSRCQGAARVAAVAPLPAVGKTDMALAERILKHWGADYEPSVPNPDAMRQNWERGILQQLKDSLGESLTSSLIAVMAEPMSHSPLRVTPLQSAAAHFYIRAGMPDSLLEILLLSNRVEWANRFIIFQAMPYLGDSLSVRPIRLHFICVVVNSFNDATADGRQAQLPEVKELFNRLDMEVEVGRSAVSSLMESHELRKARSILSEMDRSGKAKGP